MKKSCDNCRIGFGVTKTPCLYCITGPSLFADSDNWQPAGCLIVKDEKTYDNFLR